MKKVFSNSDGSSDLITVVVISHYNVSKTLILTILKKITDKYIDFKKELGSGNDPNQQEQAKVRLGEFKLYMTQIIKVEEMNFDSNQSSYRYGSTDEGDDANDSINPNQLLLANEEVDEVRLLMLDNINKLLSRGDKINRLVDQTDRLTTSSLVFQKKAQQIKRNMWIGKTKFYLALGGGIALLFYLLLGSLCGFPLFSHCIGHN
ncbi:synaptobrevin-domain-containing protein [Suhomyces tanzawaensis NRRL Y-17324]|uniref:Synaptobrevin-domain-containing protein n=1 Tax=Suhomyces tanzawaensis NRRL Y-17324 TaxID=984487 RepID=A0A1E4SJG9_9ASCO|nr:synaptobrevin-domain-containing protein [Suhomyces tanzawaensis NRRL Y-17324]ODV79651.1 synaptobrevin-domain-containing protein [Suhomyces tanzawaensis NRRL Y-17324]